MRQGQLFWWKQTRARVSWRCGATLQLCGGRNNQEVRATLKSAPLFLLRQGVALLTDYYNLVKIANLIKKILVNPSYESAVCLHGSSFFYLGILKTVDKNNINEGHFSQKWKLLFLTVCFSGNFQKNNYLLLTFVTSLAHFPRNVPHHLHTTTIVATRETVVLYLQLFWWLFMTLPLLSSPTTIWHFNHLATTRWPMGH